MKLILSLVTGFVIGSLGFIIGKAATSKETVAETQKQAKHTPMVVSMVFGQPPTKSFLVDAVLKPNRVLFLRHFAPKASLFDTEISNRVIDKRADEILRWYNPEYNELLLIAHPTGKLQDEGNQSFVVDFVWKKPTIQKPGVFICPMDALEGIEKYYEYMLGNPMLLGNQEAKQ